MAGEQAGLSIDQMIEMLNSGMNVETVLELISGALSHRKHCSCRFEESLLPHRLRLMICGGPKAGRRQPDQCWAG